MSEKNWGKHEGVIIFLRKMPLGIAGQIYMARRLATDRPFVGCYAAPGGSVDDGETHLVAAVRELQEETGLLIDATRFRKLGRTGPHLTPPEKQGSGTPYHLTYYGVDLTEAEVPQHTEPEKQSAWELRSYASWILAVQLTPGTNEMMEKFHHTKALP